METETKRSFCRVCHAACPIDVVVEGNRVVAIKGVEEDPLFEGYTCIKGRQLPDQIHHPGRLREVLRRGPAGTFEAIPGAEAFDEIAAKIQHIIETYGPRAVASYTGTGGYQASTAVETARAWHKGFGSPSFYTSVTIDQPAKTTAPMRLGAWEAGFHDFSGSDVQIAVGYNPMVSSYGPVGHLQGTNPFVTMRRAKERGFKLIVVDPRRTELAAFADIFLQVRPGEDPTLLAGFIRIILSEGLHDHEFCEQWVSQLSELMAAVDPFTPEYVAERCDVAVDDVIAAARMFAAGPRGTVGTGTGPNMSPHPSLSEHLGATLNVICGRVNREGDTLESGWLLYADFPRRAQAVAPKEPTTGAPARLRNLRGYRGEMPTSTLAEEMLLEGDGKIRALIVSGGNPVVAWPDHELTMRALQSLELLVVIDHRMAATAEIADYVIPARLSLERADVPHLMDRWFRQPYSNYTPAIVEPDGDVYAEWEVFWELGRRLGSAISTPGGDLPYDHKPTDDEVIDRLYATSRMPIADYKAALNTVHPDRAIRVLPADPECTARFTVAPSDLVAELAVVSHEQTSAEVFAGIDAARFPFRLVCRRLKATLNSLGPELPGLARKGTTNYAYMNHADLDELGIADDDVIEITSPRASMLGVVQAAADVRRGVISMAHSWGGTSATDEKVRDIGAPTNRLISTTGAFDPVTGMVVQSSIPVSVRLNEAAFVAGQ